MKENNGVSSFLKFLYHFLFKKDVVMTSSVITLSPANKLEMPNTKSEYAQGDSLKCSLLATNVYPCGGATLLELLHYALIYGY